MQRTRVSFRMRPTRQALSLFSTIALAGVLLAVPTLTAQQPATTPTGGAPARDAAPPTWDVTAPFGPTSTIAFDTTEGTWMNVDVSHDGQHIVFDLLGDLYVMSIAGSGTSPATRLTSGPAFDMQPRFSPDGKAIAFASDRSGLFNVWVMDADGKNPKAVSREQRWWVNSPTWSPDGQHIFARRHFVQTRSLGAGEIWAFHRAGGDGLQVTEKASWQKDAGEPAISPDGRYLYFSKDVSPGQNFEYNRDPHGIIYAIVRRDLQTGRERTYVQRAGGSITPRPSPDGKWLAFIRRVDTGSQLFVKDVATGAERAIFARLDKDQQEAWSMFGPYAQYAWLPDSSAIVVWGEGRIWRVAAHGGGAAGGRAGPNQSDAIEIPFTARVEQTITDAIRFPVEVHPDRFTVRMLRDAVVSPDGTLVVYSALGKLYARPLPTGEPKRLTTGDDLESDPSFAADGRSIVYASWRDADRGRIKVVAVSGGAGRAIVTTPGHYTDPSFSPDGRQIVYRAIAGDDVRGPTDGERPASTSLAPTGAATPRLVREDGSRAAVRPHRHAPLLPRPPRRPDPCSRA